MQLPLVCLSGCLCAALAATVEDVSSLIQKSASPSVFCQKNSLKTRLLQDADFLKKTLDESTTAIKLAASIYSATKKDEGVRTVQKQSEERKKRGEETRTAIREQVRDFLKRFPSISSAVRGVLVGWITPQLVELRRSSGPEVQDLIDDLAGADLLTTTVSNIDAKVAQLGEAFGKSGHEGAARDMGLAAPILSNVSAILAELTKRDGQVSATVVMHKLADLVNALPVQAPVKKYASDLATIVDRNRDLAYNVPKRSVQLLHELNVSVDGKVLTAISQGIVELVPLFAKGAGNVHLSDVLPRIAKVLKGLGLDDNTKMIPTILEFFGDVSKMNQEENVDRAHVLLRVGQFLSDLELFDKVGGATGVFTGLMRDLAQFYEGHGQGPEKIIPRFAQLADELQVLNSSTRETLGGAFEQAASFACSITGVRQKAAICSGLQAQEPKVVPPAALVLLATGATRYDGEPVGEAVGSMLQSLAARDGHGELALLQQAAAHRPRAKPIKFNIDPCDKSLSQAADEIALGTQRLVNASVGKKVAQQPEAKRREPATRSAVHTQLSILLARMPSVPAVARGLIASYATPKIMAFRRHSEPNVVEFIDNLAALDVTANVDILGEMAAVMSHGGKNSTEAGLLLKRVATIAQRFNIPQPIGGFLDDLAAIMQGDGDKKQAIPQRATQLLRDLGVKDSVIDQVSQLSSELLSIQESGESATVLPRVADLINKLGMVTPAAQDQIATAVTDAALFVCSMRGMHQYVPACSAVVAEPEAPVPEAAPTQNPAAASLSLQERKTQFLDMVTKRANQMRAVIERTQFKQEKQDAPKAAPAKKSNQVVYHRNLTAAKVRPVEEIHLPTMAPIKMTKQLLAAVRTVVDIPEPTAAPAAPTQAPFVWFRKKHASDHPSKESLLQTGEAFAASPDAELRAGESLGALMHALVEAREG